VPEIDVLVDSLKNKWKLEKVAQATAPANRRFYVCKKAFGDDYLYAGAGTQIEIP